MNKILFEVKQYSDRRASWDYSVLQFIHQYRDSLHNIINKRRSALKQAMLEDDTSTLAIKKG